MEEVDRSMNQDSDTLVRFEKGPVYRVMPSMTIRQAAEHLLEPGMAEEAKPYVEKIFHADERDEMGEETGVELRLNGEPAGLDTELPDNGEVNRVEVQEA